MLHSGFRCGYVFGLALSVIVFMLSFFLKEERAFGKWRSALVAVLFRYAFVSAADGLYTYLMENDTLYD